MTADEYYDNEEIEEGLSPDYKKYATKTNIKSPKWWLEQATWFGIAARHQESSPWGCAELAEEYRTKGRFCLERIELLRPTKKLKKVKGL